MKISKSNSRFNPTEHMIVTLIDSEIGLITDEQAIAAVKETKQYKAIKDHPKYSGIVLRELITTPWKNLSRGRSIGK